jgi:hypothetical protein
MELIPSPASIRENTEREQERAGENIRDKAWVNARE